MTFTVCPVLAICFELISHIFLLFLFLLFLFLIHDIQTGVLCCGYPCEVGVLLVTVKNGLIKVVCYKVYEIS